MVILSYQLTFEKLLFYGAGKSGISVPVMLQLGKLSAYVDARLDTGSSHCIFQRLFGEELGLDIENGYKLTIGTANGSFTAYGHNVTLLALDYRFESMVYFAVDDYFSRDILGRYGFLNKLNVAIFDYQGELYLSRNDS
jgi:hypothetical protein